ncbi:MAG TPA: hypothetical protein VGR00_08430, partial [Thermoanaerobaculia bacterium]|nr:hypothetical protein [Thermoanaerobaculia bacterium]
ENIADTAVISFDGEAIFSDQGHVETVRAVHTVAGADGALQIQGILKLLQTSGSYTFFGNVATSTGAIWKLGTGTQILEISNNGLPSQFNGSVAVDGGTLVVDGIGGGEAVNVHLGATFLSGVPNGSLVVQSSGSASAGSNPMVVDGGPGTLSLSGAFSPNSGSNLKFQINGTTAGTQYDKVVTAGTATITGANLQLTLGYAPAVGDAFTILQAASITGTFSGHPNGSSFTVGPQWLHIDYAPTNVTLTACAPISSAGIAPSVVPAPLCPGGAGPTFKVTNTAGGPWTQQWGYRTAPNGAITLIPTETGVNYNAVAADFPGTGTFYLVCVTSPSCGPVTVSNEVQVDIGDAVSPTPSAPGSVVVTQTECS